jgi:hypothetical protein
MVIRQISEIKNKFTYHLSKGKLTYIKVHRFIQVDNKECIPVSDGLCQSNRDPSESFIGKDDK